MMHLTASTPIFLATQPVDFRKGMDGFIHLCKQQLQQDPRSGARFVFINRAHTLVRVLTYDGTGFWLMTKRLSKGRFTAWPKTHHAVSTLTASQIRRLLKGEDDRIPAGEPSIDFPLSA